MCLFTKTSRPTSGHLVPRLRMSGGTTPLPIHAFAACIGTAVSFTFTPFHLICWTTVWCKCILWSRTSSGLLPHHKSVYIWVAKWLPPTRQSCLHSACIGLQVELCRGRKRTALTVQMRFLKPHNYAISEVLTQRCWKGFRSFGMLSRVDLLTVTDVSVERNASIFKILDYLTVNAKALHLFETSLTNIWVHMA
jgi:hypothetical protein